MILGLSYNIFLIVMINSQSISLGQKKQFWKQHKEDRFKEMAGNKCAMFNYFYNNNDIFHFIDDKDFGVYSLYLLYVMDLQSKIFVGSMVSVLLIDKFIVNRFLPHIRFKQWRLTANLIKFLVWPTLVYKVCDHYALKPYRQDIFKIQEKYHFGFDDYLKGNVIFQRALQVNRLEQLLEKRQKFDWEGVPQIQ